MLIDTHCHLDHCYFKDDLDKVIENAKKAGLKIILTAGLNPETNRKTLEIGISEKHFKILEGYKSGFAKPIFLLEEIATVLHEIIHILFPNLSEKQTQRKTKAWIRRNEWLQNL